MQHIFILLWAAALLGLCQAGHVQVLTSRNFAKVNEGDWLLKFYAPWCGHCKRMEPMYEALAKTLADSSTSVGKVDGSAERSLTAIFSVAGFPFLFYVAPDGQTVYPYKGPRSEEALVEFVEGGYKEVEALSFWTGPFGLVGQMKWFLLYLGELILTTFEWLAERFGYVVAGVIMLGVAMVGTASVVVGMTVATGGGDVKRD